MYLYKINNLKQITGNLDYKGIDLKQVVAGTQVYPSDFDDRNYCLLGSSEHITHDDVVLLTEEEYVSEKELIESEYPVIVDEESRIENLEKDNHEIKLAMAEMAELIIGGVE